MRFVNSASDRSRSPPSVRRDRAAAVAAAAAPDAVSANFDEDDDSVGSERVSGPGFVAIGAHADADAPCSYGTAERAADRCFPGENRCDSGLM
eukprot:5541919-Pleurochrysis_carterae.AAC.2